MTVYPRSDLLVSPDWLAERLGEPGVRVVDGSWYLPQQNRDAKAEYRAAHIPGAVFFDIDAIADTSSALPHMLPSPASFAAVAGQLGISERDTIVVYDGVGLFSAPRVWWTFRVFGAHDVRVLDGGFPAWREAGFATESGEVRPEVAMFEVEFSASSVRNYDEVAATLASGAAAVVDARPAARFNGASPEPRQGLAPGHMPGAFNLPFDRLVKAGRLLPSERLSQTFQNVGVDLSRPVVTTCGSGVTAAVLLFALSTLGKTDLSLYDGAWAEWASTPGSPIAVKTA